jgi:hypothetical protein
LYRCLTNLAKHEPDSIFLFHLQELHGLLSDEGVINQSGCNAADTSTTLSCKSIVKVSVKDQRCYRNVQMGIKLSVKDEWSEGTKVKGVAASATGTRTRGSCVKGKYVNHLHHSGYAHQGSKC